MAFKVFKNLDVFSVTKEQKICTTMDVVVSEFYRKTNKRDRKAEKKYFNLFGQLKKLRNKKVTIRTINIEALGTMPSNQEKRLEELEIQQRSEIILTTASPVKATRYYWGKHSVVVQST